jgi:hypothetical protein
MSAKDYRKLSVIFGESLARVYALDYPSPEFDAAYGVWRSTYSDICEMLAEDNPHFDEMKFQYAVALIAGTTTVAVAK